MAKAPRATPTANLPQRSFTSGELSPDLHARNDLAKYLTGAALIENFLVLPYGGLANRPGLEFCGTAYDNGVDSLLVEFVAATDDTYCLEFSDGVLRIWRNGALVLYPAGHPSAGNVVLIVSPYTAEYLWNDDGTPKLKWEQSNDVLTILHPEFRPRELTRFDHHDWVFAVANFQPRIGTPTGVSAVATKGYDPDGAGEVDIEHIYKVAAISEVDGEEGLPSSPDSCLNKLGYDMNYNTVTWSAVAGAERYALYKGRNGVYGLLSYSPDTTFKDDNISVDYSLGPRQGNDPFVGDGNFPQSPAFYEQRRVFMSSVEHPSRIWLSRSSDFDNMDESDPLRDDDAIEFSLAARSIQKILWGVSMEDLILLTTSTIWKVSGAGGDAITPSSINAKPQAYYGSANVRPIVVGTDIMFVQRGGFTVRSIAYSLEADRYVPSDRTVMASHLFEGKQIVDWAYAQNPFSNIHAFTDDHAWRAFCYLPEHEVWGWSRMSTDGRVRSNAAVPEGDEDILYCTVRRFVGGEWRQYIERLHHRQFSDVADCFFVDSGLTFDDPRTVTAAATGAMTTLTVPAHGWAYGDEVDIQGLALWRETAEGLAETRTIAGHHHVGTTTVDTFELVEMHDDSAIDTTGWLVTETGVARKCVDEVAGLDHLEGRHVVGLGDGIVVDARLVVGGVPVDGDGSPTLPHKAGRWHFGLRYVARLQTLELEPGAATAMMNAKAIVGATIYVKETRGIAIGPDFDNLIEDRPRDYEDYADPATLKTGIIDQEFGANWNKKAQVCIEQRYPLPATILAVVPGLEYGGAR